jgi:hypothetical protein
VARQELKGVLVKMPRSIKTPLAAQSVGSATSVNDVAVGILADKLGFAFSPSGRRPAFKPNPGTEDVVLRVPEAGKRKIQGAALRAGVNMSDFVNCVLAEHYEVEYEANGRKRVPFGGGRRAAAPA